MARWAGLRKAISSRRRFQRDRHRFQRPARIAGATFAAREGVEVRLYTIIYEAVADFRAAMEGLLEPTLPRADSRLM